MSEKSDSFISAFLSSDVASIHAVSPILSGVLLEQ